MQKTIRSFGLMIGVWFFLSGFPTYSQAHTGGKYLCFKTRHSIQIDGRLDEPAWKESQVETVRGDQVPPWYRFDSRAGGPAMQEFDYEWCSLWDDENWYIGFKVNDKFFISTDPYGSWIELFLDPYHLGYGGGMRGFGAETQWYLYPNWKPEVGKPRVPYTEINMQAVKTDEGYTMEIAVPLSLFTKRFLSPVRKEKTIGFDIKVDTRNFNYQLSWSGGENQSWIHYSYLGDLSFVGEKSQYQQPPAVSYKSWSDCYGSGLWYQPGLIDGSLILSMPYYACQTNPVKPWHLGEVHVGLPEESLKETKQIDPSHLLGTPAKGPLYHIEDVGNAVFLYRGVGGKLQEREVSLRELTTLFHPAKVYETDGGTITLFLNMGKYNQPTGPTAVYMPCKGKENVINLCSIKDKDRVIYSCDSDGRMECGWMLVWFATEKDNLRVNDVPILITFTHNPREVVANNLSSEKGAEQGLTFFFPPENVRFTLMPLMGVKTLEPKETLKWLKTQKLTQDILKQCSFWYQASIRIPIQTSQRFRLLEEDTKIRIEDSFNYTDDWNEWKDSPIVLAPLLYDFALPKLKNMIDAPEVEDLDYPLVGGSYLARLDTKEVTYTLKVPEIKKLDWPSLDKVASHPEARAYLEELNSEVEGGLKYWEKQAKAFQANEVNRPGFPNNQLCDVSGIHTVWMAMAYPYLRPELQERLKKIVFNDLYRSSIYNIQYYRIFDFYPTYPYYSGTSRAYLGPRWPGEQGWNLMFMLGYMHVFSYMTDNFEWVKEAWPLLKLTFPYFYISGCYRYGGDADCIQGEAIMGMVEAAKAARDEEYYRQALLMLTLYAHTMIDPWLTGHGINPALTDLRWYPPCNFNLLVQMLGEDKLIEIMNQYPEKDKFAVYALLMNMPSTELKKKLDPKNKYALSLYLRSLGKEAARENPSEKVTKAGDGEKRVEENLVVNPGFELDFISGWNWWGHEGCQGYLCENPKRVRTGKRSVMVEWYEEKQSSGIWYQWIKEFEGGTRYKLMGWAYLEDENHNVEIAVDTYEKGGKRLKRMSLVGSRGKKRGEWIKLEAVFEIPVGTEKTRIELLGNGQGIGNVYFDDLSLCRIPDE